MKEVILEDRWMLKCRMLSYLFVYGIPEDSNDVRKMVDNVFGKDCTFEKVDKQRKKEAKK